MTRDDSEVTGELGVLKAKEFFLRRKHIFREQSVADHGIDAHVEFRDSTRVVSGRLVALQIKSGDDVFRRAAGGTWAFYPSRSKVDYWLNHALPVYVVYWHETSEVLYAVEVTEANLLATRSGHKLIFGDGQRLTDQTLAQMERRSNGTDFDHRLAALRLSLSLRENIPDAENLWIGVQHWHRDGTNRCQLSLHSERSEAIFGEIAAWTVQLDVERIPAFIRDVFMWADVSIDKDFYWTEQVADWQQYLIDTGRTIDDLSYIDWWNSQPEDRPYGLDDDISNWQFVLRLNELGRAWALIEDYATAR